MSPLQRRILGAAITVIPLILLLVLVPLVPPLALVSVCLGMVAGVGWLVRWARRQDRREHEVRALEQALKEGR